LQARRLATWLAPLVVFVFAACAAAWAVPVPWAGNGHWYEAVYVGPGGITRTDAQNAAAATGGYLATCTSAAENDFVYSLVSDNDDFWFTDIHNNGVGPWLGGYFQGGWKWVTGEPWSYANWTPLHPAGSENFMGFLGLGTLKAKTWANFFGNMPCRGYIVERDTISAFSVSSMFDSDLDGWTGTGDGTISWQGSGGNPDGYLQAEDPATGGNTDAVAPPKFLGNWSLFENTGSLSADLTIISGGAVSEGAMFQISGPGGAAHLAWPTADGPPHGEWATFKVPIVESHWTVTSGTWDALLPDVQSLLIDMEHITGVETTGLDNVVLSTLSPDPIPDTAYFSLQGAFAAEPDGNDDVQDFSFTLAGKVPSDRPFELRTWSYNGTGEGTNAAGDTIPSGGFDPSLKLYHPPDTLLAQNSDIDFFQGELDARIDHNTPGTPDPLQAGDYRLRLDASGSHLQGRDPAWAVDLVGPPEAMVLTGLSSAGSDSTVTSLKFGSTGAGTATLVVGSAETLEVLGPIVVANTGNGSLAVIDGGSVVATDNAIIGGSKDSNGTVTVDGAGSSWTDISYLIVGDSGSGALNISGGGLVSSNHGYLGDRSNGSGTMTVHGTDAMDNPSTWTVAIDVYVGLMGSGSLTVSGGGHVECNGAAVGVPYDGVGTVVVQGVDATGAPSTWSAGDGTFGIYNGSSLTVSDGGVLVSGGGGAGTSISLGSTATVTGTDAQGDPSTWTMMGSFQVSGMDDLSSLSITAGASVSTAEWAHIGPGGAMGTGAVVVDGAGSAWSYDDLEIDGGNSSLSITNGASVVATGNASIGKSEDSNGTVTVAGTASDSSTWDNSASVYVGGDDSAAGGSGTMTVGYGGTVNVANTLKVWDDGTVNLNGGTINTGTLVFSGSTFNFHAGTLHFTSDPGLDTALLGKILGPTPTLSGDQHLSVAGPTLLLEPLILDGGAFSAGTLVNPASLQFNSGTFNLTEDDLSIGLGGLFGHTLEVAADQTIQVTNNAQVHATGRLTLSGGAFSADETANHGEIQLGGGNSLLAGTLINNQGLLSGGGQISAWLHNASTGQVNVGPSQRLLVTGSGSSNEGALSATGGEIEMVQSLDNLGQINVVDGTFSVGGILRNVGPTSYISGQGTTNLRFGDVLSNNGTVGFSAAEANLYGEVYNGPDGLIAVAGQSTATFVGFIENNGQVYVGDGSKAVFLSRVIGPGSFPGDGDVEFVDGFVPGNSPAAVDFGGNVTFASTAWLEIELGGLAPGQYDAVHVVGRASLDGRLEVTGIDAFEALPGDEFTVLSYGTRAGEFDQLDTTSMPAGLSADLIYDDSPGEAVLQFDGLAGDADLDGYVNQTDLDILATNWDETDKTRAWKRGDFNDDGSIDIGDLTAMAGNWKTDIFDDAAPEPFEMAMFDAALARAAVPEPSTLVLLACSAGVLPLLWRRRRWRWTAV